jgi:uncharacterized membrane protein
MADRETNRVEAFSDGVFAIAITLLILEIKVPDLSEGISNGVLMNKLMGLWPSYFAFLLSFTATLIMWVNHHGFFNYLRTIDSRFLFANGFLLLVVTFLPFPTAVLAKYINTDAASSASVFYCGTFVLISIAYNLLWFTAAYKRRLIKHDLPDAIVLKIRNAYFMGFFVYFSSFVLSFYHEIAGLAINLSLWIFWTLLDYTGKKAKE